MNFNYIQLFQLFHYLFYDLNIMFHLKINELPHLKVSLEFGSESWKSVLFCRESTAYDERWEGARLGCSEAVSFLGVDEAAPLTALGRDL